MLALTSMRRCVTCGNMTGPRVCRAIKQATAAKTDPPAGVCVCQSTKQVAAKQKEVIMASRLCGAGTAQVSSSSGGGAAAAATAPHVSTGRPPRNVGAGSKRGRQRAVGFKERSQSKADKKLIEAFYSSIEQKPGAEHDPEADRLAIEGAIALLCQTASSITGKSMYVYYPPGRGQLGGMHSYIGGGGAGRFGVECRDPLTGQHVYDQDAM